MFQGSSSTNYNALEDELHCNYDARIPFRDPIFAVLFLTQFCAILAIAIVYGHNVQFQVDNGGDDPAIVKIYWPILSSIGISVVAALALGLAWLRFLQSHSESIIKTSMMANVGLQLILALFALMAGLPIFAFMLFLSAGLIGVWYYMVRERIKFVSALLDLSVSAISQNPAMIWVSLVSQIVAVVWVGIWSTAMMAVVSLNPKSEGDNLVGLYAFLMILSFFWTLEVLRNSIHTTASGVYGTYYFFGNTRNPTLKSAKRTFTTSFGSVCLGSLIVSVIETLRALFRSQRDRDNNNLANVCVDCILGCIESLVAYISKFAFTRVAVYGESFFTAARNTFDLFKSKGIDIIISDDLSGFALISGSIIGGAVAGVTGTVSSLALIGDAEVALIIGISCFIIGCGIVSIMLTVLTSGVATFLVLWADEPQALQANHPRLYTKLSGAVRSQYPTFIQPIV